MDLSTLQTGWILALVVCWGALLFGGFFTGKLNADQTHRMPTWTRLASSLALVIAAWTLTFALRGSTFDRLALLFAFGMSLGLLGDLFMAEALPFPNRVLGGIGAFGVGHLFYIAGLLNYGDSAGLDDPSARWGALIIWLLLALILWYLVVFRGAPKKSFLHYAALPYALLLASTAAFASGLALQTDLFLLAAGGAALFLLSDLILAAQLFNGLHFRMIGDVIWLTYGPGQMLIVYGVFLTSLIKA